ncbi:Hypothetical predicted protein [Paramuricea clavata]|uniref:Uncharacterized protein n=1 Tax=Paramuricea clavata TaxID=317549 RepID=A0A7D9LBN2_PARCT|nr:Hypothetical predicted protein [Paramuricea clavata]
MALFSVFKLLFVYLLLFVIPGKANIQQHSNRIERWAEQLSFEVNNVLEKNFGLTKFQSLIDQALYQRISSQGSELLNNISIAVDEKLQDVLRTLISNKVLLETELILKDRPFRTVNCCDRRGKLRYDASFRSNVDRNSSCVLPPRGNSYLTSRLEENYKRNVLTSKAIKWQYFGSNNGSYHQYPRSEHRCAKEEIFDPRLR